MGELEERIPITFLSFVIILIMNFFIRRDRRRGPEGEELPPRPLTRVEKLRAQVFLGETFKIKSDLLFVPTRMSIENFFSKVATLVYEIFQFNLSNGIFFTFYFVDSYHQLWLNV